VPKERSLRHHYETLHKDKFGVLEGKLREDKLRTSDMICSGNRICLLLQLKQVKQ
jgi:hypothetical protein